MIEARRARRAFLWVGVIVPLVIILVAALLIASWLPELPDPVAIHWDTGGPNGYGPAWTYLVLTLGIGGGMVVLSTVLALVTHRGPQSSRTAAPATAPAPQWSLTARFLGAVNLGVASMISLLMVVSVNVQRGLEDAAHAPDTTLWMFVGFALLIGVTVLGWFLQPRVDFSADAGQHAALPIELAPGEKAAWFGTAAMGRVGVISLLASMLVLVAATILVFIVDAGGVGWIMVLVTVLVFVLIATTLVFRIRVNSDGLFVRSAAGWPRWNIPASQIADVQVVQVNPTAEFGGWGLRLGVDGRMGIVLRTGEALQVARTTGRVFVVTVDDANTAAAVLTAAMKANS